MPNHVTNKLTFDREHAITVFGACCPNDRLDFEKLVPSPPHKYEGDLSSEDDKDFQCNWGSWNRVNWGTKWNAYDATIEGDGNQARLRFQTAWASPAPVLTALAAAERDLTFQYWAFDEGWNFYAVGGGVGEIRIDERKSPERNDPAVIEAHRVCYGRDPEDDEEEDDGDED